MLDRAPLGRRGADRPVERLSGEHRVHARSHGAWRGRRPRLRYALRYWMYFMIRLTSFFL